MKDFENWQREVAEGEISASNRLARHWLERVWQDMDSSSGGGIGNKDVTVSYDVEGVGVFDTLLCYVWDFSNDLAEAAKLV